MRSDGTAWCSLPNLPGDNGDWAHHTQSGLITCGGYYHHTNYNSCVIFDTSDGSWKTSHHLLNGRIHHSSWLSAKTGVILMGGSGNDNDNITLTTTERLNNDGGSEESFYLRYALKYLSILGMPYKTSEKRYTLPYYQFSHFCNF